LNKSNPGFLPQFAGAHDRLAEPGPSGGGPRSRLSAAVLTASLLFLAFAAAPLPARVARVDVQLREDVLGGRKWGNVGPYEKLAGRVYFRVRPDDPHNRAIVDLDRADRNRAGEVEFSAGFYILRPKEPAKGNGALLLEISNRGGKSILGVVNGGRGSRDPVAAEEFGDGFLLNQGYTVAWVGWQYDAVPGADVLRLYAPIARGPNGTRIRGLVRTDFTLDADRDEMPLGHLIQNRLGGTSYPVADRESDQNILTVRDLPCAPRMIVPRDQWQFGPNNDSFRLSGGFRKGRIYELVYIAQDPAVSGLGFASVRDFVSYLKHDPTAVAPVRRAYGVGISQSGRFLRHMIYQDFNADERGRPVFDGMISHVAGAGRGSFNHRFAQPSRDAQPMNAFFYPTDIFPFADSVQTDPETGERDGLLSAAIKSHTVPKLFLTHTSYEYWGRAASLLHTSPDGKRDLTPAANVRIYFEAGLQHYSTPFPPRRAPETQNADNPNPVRWLWRAMITNLDAWVARAVEPPPSVYPKLSDGTLVALGRMRFPYIVSTNLPRDANQAYHVDYGPEFKSKGIVASEPPLVGRPFPIFVPNPDPDGQDTGGIMLPELAVPLATYTGWNLRAPQIGAPTQRVSFIGSYLPLAKTRAERASSGDPRLSIQERYSDKEQYLQLYRKAAERLIEQRFLLPEDLPAILERGALEWDYAAR
jgi:hypothetical protein